MFLLTKPVLCVLANKYRLFFRVPAGLGDSSMSQTAVKKLVTSMTPCTVEVTCRCLTQLVRS